MTRIRFTIPETSHVDLVIYDVAGRRVKKLIDRRLAADHYEVLWDGTKTNGNRVASGVYFYRIKAGKYEKTRKMVLLREINKLK
ncbi:MAG: T9SS type A sorting domain-containing protein [Candidatus Krumholzibacteriota bacterium]|nr:T9SS type A sorting domain-containing protein [Candidatus Krumholzibacteriota bacterium]